MHYKMRINRRTWSKYTIKKGVIILSGKDLINECEGWDSNPWTPSGTDLKSAGFGQAYLPSPILNETPSN